MDLVNLGKDLSDKHKALHLLNSLPLFFQSLTRVLIHRDKKTITYNEVNITLLTEDFQRKLMVSSQPSNFSRAALYVTRAWSHNQRTRSGTQN
jgi:hypothetical protein